MGVSHLRKRNSEANVPIENPVQGYRVVGNESDHRLRGLDLRKIRAPFCGPWVGYRAAITIWGTREGQDPLPFFRALLVLSSCCRRVCCVFCLSLVIIGTLPTSVSAAGAGHGDLLRSRSGRELLCHAPDRAALAGDLPHSSRNPDGDLGVHRGLLQPSSPPLSQRSGIADRIRKEVLRSVPYHFRRNSKLGRAALPAAGRQP